MADSNIWLLVRASKPCLCTRFDTIIYLEAIHTMVEVVVGSDQENLIHDVSYFVK